MSEALDAAADWWAGELMSPKYGPPVTPEIAAKFRAKMRETLPAYIGRAKKDPAWHVWTNGAVIISVDYSPCPYLLEVCEACGIDSFRGLESSGMFSSKLTMWIERDRVIVMVGAGERRVIWLR